MPQTTINQITDNDLRFIREPEVLNMFPVSRSQLWKLIKEGRFPAPVKLSERCSAWRMSDLRDHSQKLQTKFSGNRE